jgi:hypothetical protein
VVLLTEKLDPKSITDEIFEELISIAHFEYKDTKTMTSDPLMSIDDILKMINRDSKINSILNE